MGVLDMKKIINALVTPFDDDNHIDYHEIDRLLLLAKENCNDALVVCSTTGEGTLLTQEEKIDCFKYVTNNTDLPCIYPINQMSFDGAKKEIELTKDLNFDTYLIVTPFYVKPSQEGLFIFFKELAKVSYPKKIIIYNVSSRTGVNISYFTIRKLIKSSSNIVGIKECSSDFNLLKLLKANFPKFHVYLGEDSYFYEGLECNVDGFISVISILYGKMMKEVIEDYQVGFTNQITVSYLKLVCEIIFSYSNPIGIKSLLSRKGYSSMNLRLPLVAINTKNTSFDLL